MGFLRGFKQIIHIKKKKKNLVEAWKIVKNWDKASQRKITIPFQ